MFRRDGVSVDRNPSYARGNKAELSESGMRAAKRRDGRILREPSRSDAP
jgi:hypothetical protein